MPTPAEVGRLAALPLVFLVATGRSGSMLVQAFLDGHNEILQWPHTFKLFDFLAANTDFASRDGADLGKAFLDFPAHHALFDSSRSVIHGGRLGEDMRAVVTVDRDRFLEAMTAALPRAERNPRNLVAAIHASLASCLGWSTANTRAMLIHLHHGDWLWPDDLVETYNIEPHLPWRGIDLIRPEKIIVSVRNPVDTIDSTEAFCEKACASPTEAGDWFELYMRLLVQDWLRLEYLRSGELDTRVVHLDALRQDPVSEVGAACRWIGVSVDAPQVLEPTAYGLPWWGDSYTEPRRRPKPPRAIRKPSWINRDHVFFELGAGRIGAEAGYPRLGEGRARWAARLPAWALWFADRLDRRKGRYVARESMWRERSRFLRALRERTSYRNQ
ncbi:MAG: hypothetical protein IPP91_07345 [Betaproteobacteria bacterium]|nr:hypothetical protein [Betaproteobacteria bacterium]